MAKRGRPRANIDWTEFDKLCAMWCTLVEIAAYFDCSVDTIERAVKRQWKMKFAEYYDIKSARGRVALRRVQLQTALRGNVRMQEFLGTNYLGQSKKIETTNSTQMTATVQTVDPDDVRRANELLETEC